MAGEGLGALNYTTDTPGSPSVPRALRLHIQAPAVIHHCSLRHSPEGSECRKQQHDLLCKWPGMWRGSHSVGGVGSDP